MLVDGGNARDDALHVVAGDGGGFGFAGGDPGGPGEVQGCARHAVAGVADELLGGRMEDVGFQSDGLLAAFEQAPYFFFAPRPELNTLRHNLTKPPRQSSRRNNMAVLGEAVDP